MKLHSGRNAQLSAVYACRQDDMEREQFDMVDNCWHCGWPFCGVKSSHDARGLCLTADQHCTLVSLGRTDAGSRQVGFVSESLNIRISCETLFLHMCVYLLLFTSVFSLDLCNVFFCAMIASKRLVKRYFTFYFHLLFYQKA